MKLAFIRPALAGLHRFFRHRAPARVLKKTRRLVLIEIREALTHTVGSS